MFDYAANAVVYWPIGQIRSRFEQECELGGIEPEQRLSDFLRMRCDPDGNGNFAERFWNYVDTNLRAGRIKMVFVGDVITAHLRRTVEFLKRQMNSSEVLAIEIKQIAGSGVTTLVPTVIGQTAQATARLERVSAPDKQWDRDSFMQTLARPQGEDTRRITESLFA